MAFEYLDLENKLLAPTQTLLSKLQVEWIHSYANARQLLSESHDTVATLGLEWYDAPLLTTTKSGTTIQSLLEMNFMPR